MKKKICLLATIFLFLVISTVFAAESITQVWTDCTAKVQCLTFSWQADPNGALSATASNRSIDGYVIQVVTNPGTTTPTDNYDITLINSDGADIMGTALTNRDTANSEIAIPKPDGTNFVDAWVSGLLTLTITGNSVPDATGVVKIYIRRP
jgi:hypothetical protein